MTTAQKIVAGVVAVVAVAAGIAAGTSFIGSTTGGLNMGGGQSPGSGSERLAWPMIIGGDSTNDLVALYPDGTRVNLKGTFGAVQPRLSGLTLFSDDTLLRTFDEQGNETGRTTLDSGTTKDLLETSQGLVALWHRNGRRADFTADLGISFDGKVQIIHLLGDQGDNYVMQTAMVEVGPDLYVFAKRDSYDYITRLIFRAGELVRRDDRYIDYPDGVDSPEGEYPSLSASVVDGVPYLAYQSRDFVIWAAPSPFLKGARIARARVDQDRPTFLPRSQHYAERISGIALVGLDLVYPRMDSAQDDGKTLIRESGGEWRYRRPLYAGIDEWAAVLEDGRVMVQGPNIVLTTPTATPTRPVLVSTATPTPTRVPLPTATPGCRKINPRGRCRR